MDWMVLVQVTVVVGLAAMVGGYIGGRMARAVPWKPKYPKRPKLGRPARAESRAGHHLWRDD